MIKSYIKNVFRIIRRHKGYSLLNIFGLSIGMAVFLLIALFVRSELGFDKYHRNYKRIFRIVAGNPGDKDSFAGTPAPLGPALQDNFPEIENFVRLTGTDGVLRNGEKVFSENRIILADQSLFEIFSFPFIKGDSQNTLNNPNSIVITESMAVKYFEKEDPIGKTLNLNQAEDMIITGVIRDIPEKSHFHFDFVIPFKRIEDLENWGAWNYYTYLMMTGGYSADGLKSKFELWAKENRMEDTVRNLFYQPVTRIHFQYNRYNLEPAINGKYISIFIAVALVILILACINFMNLSTARSASRAKEVGIKKTVGAGKMSLVRQFIGESILMAGVSGILALAMIHLSFPPFNRFAEKNIALNFTDPFWPAGFAGLILLTGILSGIYPALVLSSFQAVHVLKGNMIRRYRSRFRNLLVIFQFSVSITLIICTILIARQMSFIQNMDLGLNRENVVNIRLNQDISEKSRELKTAFLTVPGIVSASVNNYVPSNMNWNQSARWEGQQEDERTNMWVMSIDKDFIKTLQIQILEGKESIRNFTQSEGYDFILNRSAVKLIGWNTALGKEFSVFSRDVRSRVIGVVEDFHFRSLHHEVAPCAMVVREQGGQISLRIESNNISGTLTAVKAKWAEFFPGFDFDYYFLDDDFNKLYKSESKLSRILITFTTLSVFIACLGLFGLASFMAQQKTKEIGIRKVLGATTGRITFGLTGTFTRLVIIANLTAWPVAFYIMKSWLRNFVYHTPIHFAVFLIAATTALAIAFLTVGFQSIKAASADPIKSLRYE